MEQKEKVCKYCNDNSKYKTIFPGKYGGWELKTGIMIEDKIWNTAPSEITVAVIYCPYCGRKLLNKN